MYVDVGVYGHSHLKTWEGKEKALRKFERFTLEHNGYQALYAETLMSYDEFNAMFCRELYDKVRLFTFTFFFLKLIMIFRQEENFLEHMILFLKLLRRLAELEDY